MSQTSYVRYPFGAAEKQTVAYAATIAVTLNNSENIVTIGQMTGAATVNLTVNSEMAVGSNLTIIVSVDGTNRALTPGTGMTGVAQTLTANKTYALSFKYNGSAFVMTSSVIIV